MTTAAQMRKLALALPETEEKSHVDHPDFRVCGKIFAGLSADEKCGTLKLTPEIQSTVLDEANPGGSAFTAAAGAWGRAGWTSVELRRVDAGALEALLLESWRLVAPKKLVAQHEPGNKPETPARGTTAKKKRATKKRSRRARSG